MIQPQAAGNEPAENIPEKIQNPNRLPLFMRFARSCQRAHGPRRLRDGKFRIAWNIFHFTTKNKIAHDDPFNQRSGQPTPLTVSCRKGRQFVRQ
ncbi:MAG: hypothetical protein V3S64_03590 [bacterium]